ncbi:MAG TPA: ABC transporter permease [Bryobacteraceae bacterium]|jgi:putative ABC transport system permease protein
MKDHDLSQEIRAHIEEKIAELVEAGVPASAARAQALREFGNPTLIAEASREVWGWPSLDRLWQDVRYGARMMRRNPAFTAVAVLTLALGIGANTAIFGVAHSVLLAPLPYPHSDRLVFISTLNDQVVGAPDYFDLRVQAQSFDAMAAYIYQDSNLEAGGDAMQTTIASLLGDMWALTGAQPAVGRLFRQGETGGVVLAYRTFEQRFHGDASIIGRAVHLDGAPAVILGVLPRDFQFLLPTELSLIQKKEIEAYIASPFTPVNQPHAAPQTRSVSVVARRKPGISLAQAQGEVEALMARIKAQWGYMGFIYSQMSVRVVPLQQRLVQNARPALLVLLAAVACVLLIACANVANLLLARAATRQREISIRIALGAGRLRVARQFLTESLMLALAGGAAGLLLARWGVAALIRLGPADVPRLNTASIDAWVLAGTLGLSILTGLLFGMAPAISFSRGLHDTLKESVRTTSPSRSAQRLRALLAAGELALALVLLAGAGLMVKSIWRMNVRPAGFDPEHTLVMRVSLSGERYRTLPQKVAYFSTVLERLRGAPGVEAAGVGTGGFMGPLNVDEIPPEAGAPSTVVNIRLASEGYLGAIGLRLMKGRWLSDDETAPVAVVNEAFVRRVARGQDPIGKHAFRAMIVGVVEDLKADKLDADPAPEIYTPYSKSILPFMSMDVMMRVSGDAAAAASGLRSVAAETDPAQAIYGVQTLDRALAESIAPRRFNLLLLAIFASVAVLLAAIGIYGVMSYTVAQRAQEIGLRMALGAGRGTVVRMVARQGMLVAGAGISVGLVAALGLMRLMASLLFDVKPSDPQTFAAVAAGLAGVAFLACWLPARRAARVDPMVALRHE